jgi:threonylcarbamoyladenosine tRNA methylthiotransferase MtaB
MTPNKTVAFHTLGCKLNFAETSSIARQFLLKGYEKVPFEQVADVYVINTCSVTENADRECRQIIKKAKKNNPFSKVIIIGCYAQLQPESIASIEGVDLICGTHDKFKVVEHLEHLDNDGCVAIHVNNIDKINFYAEAYSLGDRTRTFLKVQDGCDYNCAFCTIPLARGKSRSGSIASVLQQAMQIANKGIKEIVLTGVNIGDFGKGSEGGKRANEPFLDLIKALDKVEGIYRFRISSIEPNLLSNEIIEFVAQSKRFMPHFHIPLQSGSNKILKLMRRRYQRELYENRVQYIKQLMPHSCIGADVITGFPGETADDFMDTCYFINELDISYLHVFTYSERPNTVAASMKNAVPVGERKKRTAILRALSDKKRRYFYTQHQHTTRPVLFESDRNGAYMYGFTDNYIKVKTNYEPALSNQITNVLLGEMDHEGMLVVKSFSEISVIIDK